MKLCPLHTDRWEFAPPDTSNTGVVITVTVITTPVLRLTMLQMRQKNPKIVKRMNSYFEGIKNMWMAKLSLFSPLPFSFSTLVIGSITFWTYLQHNNLKPMRQELDNLFASSSGREATCENWLVFKFCCVPKKSFRSSFYFKISFSMLFPLWNCDRYYILLVMHFFLLNQER